MPARAFHVSRLVEHLVAERQRLVTAQDQGPRQALAHFGRLGFRQDRRDILRRSAAVLERCLQRALVNFGRYGFDVDTGVLEHGQPKRAARRQNDFFGHVYLLELVQPRLHHAA